MARDAACANARLVRRHGSPMNAIEPNEFRRRWQELGQNLGEYYRTGTTDWTTWRHRWRKVATPTATSSQHAIPVTRPKEAHQAQTTCVPSTDVASSAQTT